MGFASYFDDIWTRRDEAEHFRESEFGRNAGFASAGVRLVAPTAHALISRLAAPYARLERNLANVGAQILARYEETGWQRLSDEMDRLEQETSDFDHSTLLASENQLLARALSLSESLDSVLRRAGEVLRHLDAQTRAILEDMIAIHELKRYVGIRTVPPKETELERRANRLIQGSGALNAQSRRLEERVNALQPVIVGKSFDRLMSLSSVKIIDKDARHDGT